MNYHKAFAAIVAAALAVAPFLPATAQAVVATIAGIVGTFVVRPSQVSGKLGVVVANIPGAGGKTDDEKRQQADAPPTGA